MSEESAYLSAPWPQAAAAATMRETNTKARRRKDDVPALLHRTHCCSLIQSLIDTSSCCGRLLLRKGRRGSR